MHLSPPPPPQLRLLSVLRQWFWCCWSLFNVLPIVCGSSVFCFLCITFCPFIFAIILKRKRKLVALLLLFYICIVTINVLWLFLTVPWVGLQYVIVAFPDHTHLLFAVFCSCRTTPLPTCHKLPWLLRLNADLKCFLIPYIFLIWLLLTSICSQN